MKPAGLPLRAGSAVILRISPLDRFLVHARSRQAPGSRRLVQNPLRDRAVGVLHAEVQVRVRIDEIQFEELALEDDFLVRSYALVRRDVPALPRDREKSAQRDRPNNPFVHRCSSRVEETPADPSMCRRGRKRLVRAQVNLTLGPVGLSL